MPKKQKSKPSQTVQNSPSLGDYIRANAALFIRVGVIEAYRESGIQELLLATLKADERTAGKIAAHFQLHCSSTVRFLNVLASIGVLTKIDNSYSDSLNISDLDSYRHISDFIFWVVGLNRKSRGSLDDPLIKSYVDIGVTVGAIKLNAGKWQPSEATIRFLENCNDNSLLALLLHYKFVMFPVFRPNIILNALTTGKSQWELAFGRKINSPFEIYATHPELMSLLMGGMHALSEMDYANLVSDLDLNSTHSVLDIGGGTGPLAIALKTAKPSLLDISIYDLPEAIGLLQSILNLKNPKKFEIRYIGGSFLVDTGSPQILSGLRENQKFDVITAGWVIHDWDDTTAVSILKRARTHLKSSGRLILLEQILPEDHIGPETILDLAMLLQTAGGKERTETEFISLLKQAGYAKIKVIRTKGRRHIIEAE